MVKTRWPRLRNLNFRWDKNISLIIFSDVWCSTLWNNDPNKIPLKITTEIKKRKFRTVIIENLLLKDLSLYIYIKHAINLSEYILSSTDRPVSFYQNSSVWLDWLDSQSWDRKPVNSNANPRFYHSATRKLAKAKEI